METGFVYHVFDTKTQQYLKTRHQTPDGAQADADRLNTECGQSDQLDCAPVWAGKRYIIHPVSVY